MKKIVAFIPVRGGSKSIPLKNIKKIAGKPLVYWVTKAANDAHMVDEVYVATDSKEIASVVNDFNLEKVCVIGRDKETASDTASTESAMLEFAKKYEFDTIILIQATSPLLDASDIDGGLKLFKDQCNVDSVISVVRQKRFNWKEEADGFIAPSNYDFNKRPRRQDFRGYLVENGAFYITSKDALLRTGNRISGRIKYYLMDARSYYEIDEPYDFMIVEKFLQQKCINHINKKKIRIFLTDCDGVLTDGGMYYSENGDELKKFNTKDGVGLNMLRNNGIITGIITGEDRELNKRRAQKLQLDEIFSGVTDKLAVLDEICKKYNVSYDEVAYVGDDINDIDIVRTVGLGCCVSDACDEVKKFARYISSRKGGHGAIREIAEYILFYGDNI